MDGRFMVVVRIERNAFGDAGGSGYGVYSSSLYKDLSCFLDGKSTLENTSRLPIIGNDEVRW